MMRNFGGNRRRISVAQRDEILRLYAGGEPRKAIAYAMGLGLREEYAYRLARERGAISFLHAGWTWRNRAMPDDRPQNHAPPPPRQVHIPHAEVPDWYELGWRFAGFDGERLVFEWRSEREPRWPDYMRKAA